MESARLEPEALRLLWADGVYFNVRLDEERTCVLVLIGVTEDGTKELLAVVDGTEKAPNPGVNCFSNSNAWDFPVRRSWPSATVRLAFGSLCRKNMVQ